MAYTIITQAPEIVGVAQQTAWSVTVSVRSSDDQAFPPKVLVFQAENPGDAQTRGWFTCVASPSQLLEYPEDLPAAAGSGELQQPYYRLDSVTFVSRNARDLDSLVAQLYEEIDLLYTNLKAQDRLASPEILLPVCRASDGVWPGSSLLGPFTVPGPYGTGSVSPAYDAVRAEVLFTSESGDGLVTFDSEDGADGLVTIVNPATWLFVIPEQPLYLAIGTWNWKLVVTDSQGNRTECYSGSIPSRY